MKITRTIMGITLATALLISGPASAALISDLPADTYITDNGINWTWASRWGTGSLNAPEAPTFHDGWRYATNGELDYLFLNLVDSFLNSGSPIESTAYWNDATQVGVDTGDLNIGAIMSGPNIPTLGFGPNCTGTTPCDTFYVRGENSVPVPAPSPLALMALSLLGLIWSQRRRV